MKGKTFVAKNWLQNGSTPKVETFGVEERPNPTIENKENTFPSPPPLPEFVLSPGKVQANVDLSNLFTPGWDGKELYSINSTKCLNLLEALIEDIKLQFKKSNPLNRAQKINFYNQFIDFANSLSLTYLEFNNFEEFWQEFKSPSINTPKAFHTYFDIFYFQVAVIYLLKLRFIDAYENVANIKVISDKNPEDLLNPQKLINSYFIKGSHLEIKSQCLKPSIFSWYRPSPKNVNEIYDIYKNLSKISIPEVYKISLRHHFGEELAELNLDTSLANKEFSLFLITLILEFPKWSSLQNRNHFNNQDQILPIINCKFTGDNLIGLSLGHWLGQQYNQKLTWKEVLAPEFEMRDYPFNDHFKICTELQFLTALLYIGRSQKQFGPSFLCKIINAREQFLFNHSGEQTNLFKFSDQSEEKHFQRIVLNISNYPKTNPQFFLVNSITSQIKNLDRNGLIFVLSSKKLFVPSHSDKVKPLLEKLKLESTFDFSSLKGRGDCPSFIYIFSKRDASFNSYIDNQYSKSTTQPNKETFLSFRTQGELSSICQFSNIHTGLNKLLLTKDFHNTSFYGSEISHNLSLQYFKDAIVNGKIIHSTQNTSNFTHPIYFRKLLKNCLTFDKLFNLQQIKPEHGFEPKAESAINLLGQYFNHDLKYSTILVVDFRHKEGPIVDIIPLESFKAKVEECGHAYCFYFTMIPKYENINANLLRKFFQTPLGLQITQTAVGQSSVKLKPKVESIFVPKFIIDNNKIPQSITVGLEFLQKKSSELLKTHPDLIFENFKKSLFIIEQLSEEYPNECLSRVLCFQHSLVNCLHELKNKDSSQSNQSKSKNPLLNQMFFDSLINLELKNLMSRNDDVYVKFHPTERSALNFPLTKTIFKKNEHETDVLEIYSSDELIFSLHSESIMLEFIDLILTKGVGYPIFHILENLKIPALTELKVIYEDLKTLETCIQRSINQTEEYVVGNIRNHVMGINTQPPN